MKRRLLATALACVVVLAGSPAQAGEQVVTATDPAGDQQMTSDPGGLSVAQRRSIDIRRLAVIKGTSSTRFVIRLKRLYPRAARFDQMVFVTLKSPASADPGYLTEIGMTAQARTKDLSYAYLTPDTTGDDLVVCDPLTAKVRKKRKVVFLDVPHTCIPAGPVKIRLTSATGTFRSEGGGYSRDRMKVAGTYVLE